MTDTVNSDATEGNAFVSWQEFFESAYTSSLSLVCLAVWLHAADGLIVATMLPSMVAEIGGAAVVGWSVSLYEIGSIVAGAASALLTMRFGLRKPMSISATIFGFGCVVSAISPNMAGVLVGRLLQGLGGGGLVAMSFVSIGVLFPKRYIARALATVSALWGISAFLGPLIGGFFVEFATWRIGFWFFAAQAFGLSVWIVLSKDGKKPETTTEENRFPVRRLGLLCVAVILIATGGIKVELLWTTGFVLAGLGSLISFLVLDSRASINRLLPTRPFNPTTSSGAALLMILALAISTVALGAYGPLLITAVHGVSPLTTGYIIASSSVGWTITAVLASGAPERFDRLQIALGIALVFVSVVGFIFSVPYGPVWLIAVFAAIEGGGFGMAWTFILRRATAQCESGEIQRISGAIPTVQRLGYALGAAYIGIVANASGFLTMHGPESAAEVARIIFLAGAPFAVLALGAMLAFIRNGRPRIRHIST